MTTKKVRRAEKVMTTVFWASCGVIFIEYLQTGRTIRGAYYASLQDKLTADIAEKRQCAVSHFRGCPPYLPDLAPSDFTNLKISVIG